MIARRAAGRQESAGPAPIVDKVPDTPSSLRGCVRAPWQRQDMTKFAVVVRWCTTCQDDTEFEQPGCADGHGGDCPEWACAGCGDAVLVGFALPEAPARSRPVRHVA